jgi:hypothetical protein
MLYKLFSDFFSDGVTKFDGRFFDAQKNRQLLELSHIIPQLKKSAYQRPYKRTKIG